MSFLKSGGVASRPSKDAVARRSGFRLNADHSAEIIDVPAFDGFGQALNCTYNGTGDWRWYENGGLMLNLNISVPTPSASGREPCAPASLSLFQLIGHSPPYRVWYNIGDPDEEMGAVYVRRKP